MSQNYPKDDFKNDIFLSLFVDTAISSASGKFLPKVLV